MAEHRTNSLIYGHLGTADYLNEAKRWQFSRQIEPQSVIHPLEHTTSSVPPSDPPSSGPPRASPANGKRDEADDLLKSLPELVPGQPFLKQNESVSSAVTTFAAHYDPLISNRLAFGNATDFENHPSGRRAIPIAAIVAGDAADSIRLTRHGEEVVPWPSQQNNTIRIPRIGTVDEAWWVGCGAPIQQICFAATLDVEERSRWMAARSTTSTTVFRPLYHRRPVPASYAEGYQVHRAYPSSKLDVNPLLKIPISWTGGFPHSDVTFNPWYHRQIAVVDQQGRWSVWDVEGRQDQSAWQAKAGPSSRLHSALDEGLASHNLHHDGWHRICWVGSFDRILVCDRQRIAFYHLQHDSNKAVELPSPDLGLSRESASILDIKRDPADPSQFFVLTSNRLFWLCMPPSSVNANQDDRTGATILLSWQHFRESLDLSLSLAPLRIGEAVLLFLYSRLNQLLLLFHFTLSSGNPSIPLSVSDPLFLSLPRGVEAPSETQDLNNPSGETIVCEKIQYEIRECDRLTDSHGNPLPKGVFMFKLFITNNDLSVSETPFYSHVGGDHDAVGRHKPGMILWSSLNPITSRPKSARKVDELDDFVVEDDDEASNNSPFGYCSRWVNNRNSYEPKELLPRQSDSSQWTVDSEVAYSIASGSTEVSGRRAQPSGRGVEFEKCLEIIGQRIQEKPQTDSLAMATLSEILGSSIYISDIDKSTQDFRDFMDSISGQAQAIGANQSWASEIVQWLFLSYGPARGSQQAPITQTSISSTYDQLVRDWLTTLPSQTPNLVRIAKEKVLRGLAAELVLASVGVRFKIPEVEVQPPLPTEMEGVESTAHAQNFNGSMEKKRSRGSSVGADFSSRLSKLDLGDKQTPNSSLPTPDPTPSLPSHRSSVSKTSRNEEDDACERLRAYTTVNSLPPLQKPMANLLSHWISGADPANYDWRRTEIALDAPADLPEDAQKAKKKAEHREKRAKLLASASQQPAAPPAIQVSARQPQAQVEPKSSQTVPEEEVTMTQTEPGAFGGRDDLTKVAAKARKKKRNPGF